MQHIITAMKIYDEAEKIFDHPAESVGLCSHSTDKFSERRQFHG